MGNLGSGKTTIAKLLASQPPDGELWQRLVIDNFRSPNRTEYEARQMLLDAVNRAKGDIIYETTCSNLIHPKVMKAITARFSEVIRVKLHITQASSLARANGQSPWLVEHQISFTHIQTYLNGEWSDMYFDAETESAEDIAEKIKTGIITYFNSNFTC